MQKIETGRVFTLEEYRNSEMCLRCGFLLQDGKRICDKCIELNLSKCNICTSLLREGLHFFYSYDSKDEIRVNNGKNRLDLKEFATAQMYDKLKQEGTCNSCIGWEKRLKNECYKCGRHFDNNKEYYKSNGNFCENCK